MIGLLRKILFDQPGRWRPGLRRCLSIWDGSQYGREKVMPHMKCYFTYSSKGKYLISSA